MFCLFFFFKQKTAYEMRISDWSSDVCSSDLGRQLARLLVVEDCHLPEPRETSTPCQERSRSARRIVDARTVTRFLDLGQGHSPAGALTTAAEPLRHLRCSHRIKEIGRAHVSTPVTNAQLVCRWLLEKIQPSPSSQPKHGTDDIP